LFSFSWIPSPKQAACRLDKDEGVWFL